MTDEKPGGIIDQVKETVTNVTEKISDVKDNLFDDDMMTEYKVMGADASTKIITQLTEARGILAKSGYLLDGVSVNIGIPPEIRLVFKFSSEIPEGERTALLEEAKGKKIVTFVLKALFKSNDMYDKIKVGSFKMNTVQIAIGLIPDVTINLSPK